MNRPPDHIDGIVQERGLTILIRKESLVPCNVTGRNEQGKLRTLAGWETSAPVDEVSLAGVARAYGFADVEEFVAEATRRINKKRAPSEEGAD